MDGSPSALGGMNMRAPTALLIIVMLSAYWLIGER
jgi:hypothetical protein